MSDGDGPNIDSFLPFSLREVPLARALLNGNKIKIKTKSTNQLKYI